MGSSQAILGIRLRPEEPKRSLFLIEFKAMSKNSLTFSAFLAFGTFAD